MSREHGIQQRLAIILGVIGVVAVCGVLAILPYRLYERDIRNATVAAHRLSNVVQAALAEALADGRDATDLMNRVRAAGDVEIALVRLESGEVRAGAVAGRGASILDDTDLRYVSTPVIDGRGDAWVAEMHFDLAPMKRESVRLIVDLVLAVLIGATLFSSVIFLLFRRALILPVRQLTDHIQRQVSGDSEHGLEPPAFESREMIELANAVEQLATRG